MLSAFSSIWYTVFATQELNTEYEWCKLNIVCSCYFIHRYLFHVAYGRFSRIILPFILFTLFFKQAQTPKTANIQISTIILSNAPPKQHCGEKFPWCSYFTLIGKGTAMAHWRLSLCFGSCRCYCGAMFHSKMFLDGILIGTVPDMGWHWVNMVLTITTSWNVVDANLVKRERTFTTELEMRSFNRKPSAFFNCKWQKSNGLLPQGMDWCGVAFTNTDFSSSKCYL